MQLPREDGTCGVSPGRLHSPGAGEGSRGVCNNQQCHLVSKAHPCTSRREFSSNKTFISMLVPFRGVQAFLSSSLFKTPGSGIVSLHELTPVLPNPWSCRQVHLVVYPVNQYLLSNTEVHSSILPPYIPCDLSSWLSYCHSTSRSMQIHHERHFSK